MVGCGGHRPGRELLAEGVVVDDVGAAAAEAAGADGGEHHADELAEDGSRRGVEAVALAEVAILPVDVAPSHTRPVEHLIRAREPVCR